MVDLEVDDGLAVITIDRPHARNAISLETMDQLEKALDGAHGAVRSSITGAGDRAFVSGGDLKELSALRTELDASAMAFRMRTICDRIAGFAGPTIAAMNGHALGGGAEFAVSADIRVAADDIKIGFNQVSLEIMPAWGGAERRISPRSERDFERTISQQSDSDIGAFEECCRRQYVIKSLSQTMQARIQNTAGPAVTENTPDIVPAGRWMEHGGVDAVREVKRLDRGEPPPDVRDD